MYRCGHCQDLHFASDQARRCAACGQDWIPQADAEAQRQAELGPLPWDYMRAVRDGQPWTPSERALWRALKRLMPDEPVLAQWWLRGTRYRVDYLIPAISLAIEVDGSSHLDRVGCDRLRSAVIRAQGYAIFRVDSTDVMAWGERIAQQIVFRIETEREGLPLQGRDVA